MKKKSFKGGIDGLLGISQETPNQENSENKFRHHTYYVRKSNAKALNDIAYWTRNSLKDLVDTIFTSYIQEYENKNGEIEPKPKRKPNA